MKSVNFRNRPNCLPSLASFDIHPCYFQYGWFRQNFPLCPPNIVVKIFKFFMSFLTLASCSLFFCFSFLYVLWSVVKLCRKTHTMGKAWALVSQVSQFLSIRRVLLHLPVMWEIDEKTHRFSIWWDSLIFSCVLQGRSPHDSFSEDLTCIGCRSGFN